MTTIEMTAEEQTKLAAMVAELHDHGYPDVEEHRGLRVGTRIRHVGHQWTEAYQAGTGVVVALTQKRNSSWSQSWGRPDVELIALWDREQVEGRLSQLAQYHVEVIEP